MIKVQITVSGSWHAQSITHHLMAALHKQLRSDTALQDTDRDIRRIPASHHSGRPPQHTDSSYSEEEVHSHWASQHPDIPGSLHVPAVASDLLRPLDRAAPEHRKTVMHPQPGARGGWGPEQNAGAPRSCRPGKGGCSYWWAPGSPYARNRHWLDDPKCQGHPVCYRSPSGTTDAPPLSKQTHSHLIKQTQIHNFIIKQTEITQATITAKINTQAMARVREWMPVYNSVQQRLYFVF